MKSPFKPKVGDRVHVFSHPDGLRLLSGVIMNMAEDGTISIKNNKGKHHLRPWCVGVPEDGQGYELMRYK